MTSEAAARREALERCYDDTQRDSAAMQSRCEASWGDNPEHVTSHLLRLMGAERSLPEFDRGTAASKLLPCLPSIGRVAGKSR